MEEKLKEIASELLAIANEMENAPQVQAEEQRTIPLGMFYFNPENNSLIYVNQTIIF